MKMNRMTNRLFNLSIVAALVVLIIFTIREAVATTSVARTNVDAAVWQNMQRMQRVRDAETARLNGQAEYYFAQQRLEAERVQRVRAAEVARLNAHAQYYTARQAQEAERVQRVSAAETARLNGLAAYFFAKQHEAERVQRAREAEIARWNAQAEYYFAKQTQEAVSNR